MPDTSGRSATQATRMRPECDTSDTSATRVRHERHQCDTSAERVLHERHECDTSEKFDFDSDTSKNIFSHTCIYYMASERLLRDEQVHSKIYLLEMGRSHAKMRLKSAPQKLNFLMAKDISKSYTLDCSCTLMPLCVPA